VVQSYRIDGVSSREKRHVVRYSGHALGVP